MIILKPNLEQKVIQLFSVSEALRSHDQSMKVKGMISSLSKLSKMISKIKFYCHPCARIVEIDFPRPVFSISNSYRIIYKVVEEGSEILILDIGHRSSSYIDLARRARKVTWQFLFLFDPFLILL
jgi:hypothetical protein